MSPSRARTSLLEKAISSKKATVNRVDIIVRVISPVRAATSVKEVTSPVRVVTSNVKAVTSNVKAAISPVKAVTSNVKVVTSNVKVVISPAISSATSNLKLWASMIPTLRPTR